MIELFFTAIFFYLLGYWAGRSSNIFGDVGESVITVKQAIKTLNSAPTGLIKPKTAKDLFNKQLPNNIKEGQQAFKETLDNSPELVAHKQQLEKIKQLDKQRGIYDV